MPVPQVITDRFPLVLVVYPEEVALDDLPTFRAELRKVYARGRLAVVADIGRVRAAISTAEARTAIARVIDSVTMEFPGIVACEAIVADSAWLRGAVVAYTWLKRDRSYPTRVFKDRTAAITWARACLEQPRQ